ncbi:hypothetical protein MTO96_009761 [Rhipicephalus appendiculatus]
MFPGEQKDVDERGNFGVSQQARQAQDGPTAARRARPLREYTLCGQRKLRATGNGAGGRYFSCSARLNLAARDPDGFAALLGPLVLLRGCKRRRRRRLFRETQAGTRTRRVGAVINVPALRKGCP